MCGASSFKKSEIMWVTRLLGVVIIEVITMSLKLIFA